MIYSAIENGNPIIAIDSNYPSLSIGDYAQSQGYDVHIFAPSFSESAICNPLDFLIDSQDAASARMLAISITRYFRELDKDNTFFNLASQQLTQAVLMLAKEFGGYADILTAAAIIKSDNLMKRLMNAELNPWIRIAFSQLFMCAESSKTAAGIIASVRTMFSGFVEDQNEVGWFIGKSTLPLLIKERSLIIFGIKTEPHQGVNPLIYSIFELFLNRHLNSDLIITCDELSFDYLSKHNYQQPIIALPKEFNQKIPCNYVASKNDKTISIDDELAKRLNEVELLFPLIKV